MTDCITLCDLEVHYRVGVPDEERRNAQRLLLTVQIYRDFNTAIRTDSIDTTTNYFAISERLKRLGDHREWKLIEKLAGDIAALILAEFPCDRVAVEVKKFIIPETRYVSVRLERTARPFPSGSDPSRARS